MNYLLDTMKKKPELVEKVNNLIAEIQQIINDEDDENVDENFIEQLDFAIQDLETAVEIIE
ncbi:hypothetical protein [Anabaena azotica]|uniref:Uncharacterized protein n=1 Tax=Anabaena azotica FACHB-119 TaxID=947527 RepID=A0ABR8DDY4_9NOST|nr:hypothetical protein [Anabaena azotica]MBD2503933.1 hypothetical protein [Anabaena azotica FACHB-119]